jgi:vancomycin resistance protein YoaR
VSFNRAVGPRSIENGFAHAGEIYKGEMRRGVGGGTCQVASTFHAAAYLGGLDVVERSPHSRPSGYIRIGLDATVAFPHVDLKMRNPFVFPVLLRAFIKDRGTLVIELIGRSQPVSVAFDAATVGVKTYKRKVRVSPWLEEGRIIRKQAGRKGVTIQKIRTLRFTDGTEKLEETHDHYPPTTEIYYVPPGTDESELPPMPQDS